MPINIPDQSGVYFFKDTDHNVMYIGKAKSLKKRISTYFHKQADDWKVNALINEHASIDWIITATELEALLLEAQLIQDYKPKYNVLLTSGNPFLYILFTHGDMPEIKLVRTKKEKGTYVGPFLHKSATRSGYEYLIRTFRLRCCNKKIASGCLDYHIGNCAGSCLDTFDMQAYRARMYMAQQALQGKFDACKQLIAEQLETAIKERAFEKAKNLYTYLQNLDLIFQTINTRFSKKWYDEDIFKAITPTTTIEEVAASGVTELQRVLNLPVPPKTIDCFDISHFQGQYIVGSCVRFTQGIPDPTGFRRFKVRSLDQQNDYAALQEIITRRYATRHDREQSLPDVVLIDGGKGQLSAAQAAAPHLLCTSLAKREERFFTPLHPQGIVLDHATPLGALLMALRDYAHHFAISYHKLLRKKGMQNELK